MPVLLSKKFLIFPYKIQIVQLAHFPGLVTCHAHIVHPTLTPTQEQHHVTAMPTTTSSIMEPASLVHPTKPLIMAQKCALVYLIITESVDNPSLSHVQVRNIAYNTLSGKK